MPVTRSGLRQFTVIPSRGRLAGIIAGVGTQACFALTVVSLFSYLRYGVPESTPSWLLVDSFLALQFAIPHSIILHPATRKALRPWISPEFYGLFFCLCTCLSLQWIFACWRSSPILIWDLEGIPARLMLAGFYASWVALLYSISLTGLGYQTGLSQWLYWIRGENMPRRDFTPKSLYRWMRHPVYLSFLGLIWFTPTMSADHAVLTGIWTVYIAIGSILKDQRLLFYLGDPYARYMQQVTGYPLMLIGPLAKHAALCPAPERTVSAATTPSMVRSETQKAA
ncbi:MAG: methyltransferase family protein [Planctomycetota bacterium]